MKKVSINVFCSLIVLVINILVNFFLSPYIVKNIGVEANGFVTLANNFVMYAQLIVTALNSMAARFISIAYVKKDYKKANLYYNSVFWGNLIIVMVLIVPAIYALFKLETIIDIPSNILLDVKLLFAFVFFNFFITTGFPNWDCGTFVSNRLDRLYIPQMVTAILKCFFLFAVFFLLTPKVYYVGLASSLVTVILLICNGINTHKLTPELKVSFPNIICSFSAIKKLLLSGIWSSISSVGGMMLTGFDLIICNLYLGSTAMGIVSLTKIIPSCLEQLASSLTNAFYPGLTINYAKNDKEKLLSNINFSMKLSSIIMTVPVSILIIFGEDFFRLWVPGQDSKLLYVLAVLASFKFMFTGGIQILYSLFPTMNKVKDDALSMVVTGIASIIITFLFAKHSSFGIYAVAGVSSLCAVLKNLIFVIPVCAKYLDLKWNTFYKQVFITFFSSIITIVIGLVLKKLIFIDSWLLLVLACFLMGIIGLAINAFVTLSRDDLRSLLNLLKKRIKKYN